MADLVESKSGLLVPRGTVQAAQEGVLPEVKCPAAEARYFQNTGRPAIRCGVEQLAYAVEDSPNSAAMYCCNEDGYTSCPSWQSERNKNPKLREIAAKKDQRRQDRITERQIRDGTRFDDRGVEAAQPKTAIER